MGSDPSVDRNVPAHIQPEPVDVVTQRCHALVGLELDSLTWRIHIRLYQDPGLREIRHDHIACVLEAEKVKAA